MPAQGGAYTAEGARRGVGKFQAYFETGPSLTRLANDLTSWIKPKAIVKNLRVMAQRANEYLSCRSKTAAAEELA